MTQPSNSHPWQEAWSKKTFTIETLTPSVIVKKYESVIAPGSAVLDIGCGNGRNALFAAALGAHVDAFDVADLNWLKNAPAPLRKNITFSQCTVAEFPFPPEKYTMAIAARVFQYLDDIELETLIKGVHRSLKPGGIFIGSFTNEGGIFNRTEITVSKHAYTLEHITKLLQPLFTDISLTEGSTKNVHVNYSEANKSFDFFCRKE